MKTETNQYLTQLEHILDPEISWIRKIISTYANVLVVCQGKGVGEKNISQKNVAFLANFHQK